MIFFEYSIPLFIILSALIAGAAVGLYSAWRFLPLDKRSVILSALFMIALALMLWALLQPGKRHAVTELIKPRFIVALDTSKSMTMAPSEISSARWETAQQALSLPWTRIVAAECQIEILPFDEKIHSVKGLAEAETLSPDGTSTLLRDSLREIASRYAGLNVAGLLLLSDGIDTREAFDDWAYEPAPFPIYTVRLEEEAEWELPPDLRVDAVNTPQRASLNWTTELKALLYGQGTESKPVSVQLFRNDVLIDEIPTRFPEPAGQREVVFSLDHPEPGVFDYRVFLPPLQDESITNDNEYVVSIYVAEDENRLLYVEGVPRWEYRFLRRVLMANPEVPPSIFYTGPDGTPRLGSPVADVTPNMTESELAHFRVVVLGNLDAEELTEDRAQNLVRFVETGGSLILLGGNKAWGENGFSNTSLRKLIPARSHAFRPLESDLSDVPYTVHLTEEARAHPAFAGDDAYWSALPSVLSVFPDVVPTLGAQVLAEVHTHRGAQPAVVSHRYGHGKVAAIFTDSLWRWQLSPDTGRTRPYQRFWTQLIAWMLPEEEAIERDRMHLFTDRDRMFLGEEMELNARVPGTPDTVRALISFPDGREVPYTMDQRHIITPAGEVFEGYAFDFEPGVPGHFTATAESVEGTHRTLSDPISFFVQPHSLETAPRPINANVLQALSTASGGKFFQTLSQLSEELSAIRIASIQEEQVRSFSLWQRWPLILLLMVLLAAAWTLRKLRNMP